MILHVTCMCQWLMDDPDECDESFFYKLTL